MRNAVLSEFRMDQYSIHSVAFQRTDEELTAPFEYQLNLKSEIVKEKEGAKSVRLTVSIEWMEDGPFDFEVSAEGQFSHGANLPEEDFAALCREHAPAVLMSQLRPFVRYLMTEANEGFRLPLIDITRTIQQDGGNPQSSGDLDTTDTMAES